MTREAKLGLLVALAFLLVIGILLSDHVTTSTREPGAPLASVEGSIRGSIGAPGVDFEPSGPPPVLPQVNVAPTPSQPFTYQPPAEQAPVTATAQPATDPWGNTDAVVAVNVTPATPPLPNQALALAATAAGEPVIPVTADPRPLVPAAPPAAPAGQQKLAGVVEYTARSGDVLSKIVARKLGRWTPQNKELFLKLNPKLRGNPDLIVVGETYLVPADAAAAEAMRGSAPKPAVAPVAAKSAPAKVRTYTVKAGDTLWRIASTVCGDADLQGAILRLNGDKISDPSEIGVGMVLKLPA